MRVISGKYKNRRLSEFKGDSIRPTTDRVKESIFNLIGQYFEGEVVLDLFAGSGNVGIEFLSRYASFVHFNDKSKQSTKLIKENLDLVKAQNSDYSITNSSHLDLLNSTNKTFDVIFLDPPYEQINFSEILEIIKNRSLLNTNGMIVIESPVGQEIDIVNYSIVKDKNYGKTNIKVLKEQ